MMEQDKKTYTIEACVERKNKEATTAKKSGKADESVYPPSSRNTSALHLPH